MPLMSHEIQFKELFVHSLLLVLGRAGPHVVQAFLTKTSFLDQFLSKKLSFASFQVTAMHIFGDTLIPFAPVLTRLCDTWLLLSGAPEE